MDGEQVIPFLRIIASDVGSGVRVLLAHGQKDKHARFAVSENPRDSLKDAGYNVTLRPFVGGHTVPNDQLDFVANWIRKVDP